MTCPNRLVLITSVSLSLALLAGCSSSTDDGTAGNPDATSAPSFSGDAGAANADAGSRAQWQTATGDRGPNGNVSCESNAECPPQTPFCSVSGQCFECLSDNDCQGDAVCTMGSACHRPAPPVRSSATGISS